MHEILFSLLVLSFRWQFIYRCILGEHVEYKRKVWSWSYIKDHGERCRKYEIFIFIFIDGHNIDSLFNRYLSSYKKKLETGKKASTKLLSDLQDLEKGLSVFNIVRLRQQAELEV